VWKALLWPMQQGSCPLTFLLMYWHMLCDAPREVYCTVFFFRFHKCWHLALLRNGHNSFF
jgi:hypothetical protein